MEQTLPRFGVTRLTSASASICFLIARFPGSYATWLSPSHFQRLIAGKLRAVDLGRPRNLQRRKVEVTR